MCNAGSAWRQDHSACAGTGLCHSVRSDGEAAGQHTGGPSADMWLLVCHVEAGECSMIAKTCLLLVLAVRAVSAR